MERITKASIANLHAADRAGLTPTESHSGVMVWVEYQGRRAYLCGSSGSPIVYLNAKNARRSMKRIRSDLEPTSI